MIICFTRFLLLLLFSFVFFDGLFWYFFSFFLSRFFYLFIFNFFLLYIYIILYFSSILSDLYIYTLTPVTLNCSIIQCSHWCFE